jgi:hypothetical protein
MASSKKLLDIANRFDGAYNDLINGGGRFENAEVMYQAFCDILKIADNKTYNKFIGNE